jgi:hypothetical protein
LADLLESIEIVFTEAHVLGPVAEPCTVFGQTLGDATDGVE